MYEKLWNDRGKIMVSMVNADSSRHILFWLYQLTRSSFRLVSNGEKSCCGNTEDIGSNECNGDFECCNSDVSQCECPSQTNVTSTLGSLASLEEAPTNATLTTSSGGFGERNL